MARVGNSQRDEQTCTLCISECLTLEIHIITIQSITMPKLQDFSPHGSPHSHPKKYQHLSYSAKSMIVLLLIIINNVLKLGIFMHSFTHIKRPVCARHYPGMRDGAESKAGRHSPHPCIADILTVHSNSVLGVWEKQ